MAMTLARRCCPLFKNATRCGRRTTRAIRSGTGTNDDIRYLRLAETTDGVHFTDLGILQGLSDPTDVTATGTRWLATAGTILKLEGDRFRRLFSGGGCIDGDSDAFRYIGFFAGRVYAPSATLGRGDGNILNVFFAGYHTPKPKNGLGDYRTIGRVTLRSSQRILRASTDVRSDHQGGDS